MKSNNINIVYLLIVLLGSSIHVGAQTSAVRLSGAWQRETDGNRIIWINADKYFSASVYSIKENKFVGTCGGTWKLDGNTLSEQHEFNTISPELIGTEIRNTVRMEHGKLVLTVNGKDEQWARIDDNTPGKLAGAWVITGRFRNGQLRTMTPGARKTMKILSGTRFQWIAYNPESKEFFGTGGGTYTTVSGKYTEHIDFFSRDDSRVGKQLSFDYEIKDGDWHHKGLSSKGDAMDEIWTKREALGI